MTVLRGLEERVAPTPAFFAIETGLPTMTQRIAAAQLETKAHLAAESWRLPLGRGVPYAMSSLLHYTILLLGFVVAVAAAPRAAGVRVWQITSPGTGSRRGPRASAAGGCKYWQSSGGPVRRISGSRWALAVK